ncbi:MAG: hypothetical protein K0Q50_2546 [Vampirovibrio sp.]|jgi:hypothetical protein|nr:hypothetical protein [Vampirovibrio sp.]
MIFKFYSVSRKCRDIILIDFCHNGWHIRYHDKEAFVDKSCHPTFQKWIEENECIFPSGLNDAFEELWTVMHSGYLTEDESQARLSRFSEWMSLFNK